MQWNLAYVEFGNEVNINAGEKSSELISRWK
jgi:hypothetical protein